MKEKDGRYLFGICKVNEKGQIVIPKEAREILNIKSGDNLVLLGDKNKGLALVKSETFAVKIDEILDNRE